VTLTFMIPYAIGPQSLQKRDHSRDNRGAALKGAPAVRSRVPACPLTDGSLRLATLWLQKS